MDVIALAQNDIPYCVATLELPPQLPTSDACLNWSLKWCFVSMGITPAATLPGERLNRCCPNGRWAHRALSIPAGRRRP